MSTSFCKIDLTLTEQKKDEINQELSWATMHFDEWLTGFDIHLNLNRLHLRRFLERWTKMFLYLHLFDWSEIWRIAQF